jgi:hypothetical protein
MWFSVTYGPWDYKFEASGFVDAAQMAVAIIHNDLCQDRTRFDGVKVTRLADEKTVTFNVVGTIDWSVNEIQAV